jgi:hypothetical protein
MINKILNMVKECTRRAVFKYNANKVSLQIAGRSDAAKRYIRKVGQGKQRFGSEWGSEFKQGSLRGSDEKSSSSGSRDTVIGLSSRPSDQVTHYRPPMH